MPSVDLPTNDGRMKAYRLSPPPVFQLASADALPRVAYAAAHVVNDPRVDNDPWLDTALDWDATLAYREHLWSLGLGVAEAMDTAQRGMGLDWPTSRDLIRRSVAAAKARDGGGPIACGVGTDHLVPGPDTGVDEVVRAYEEQCEAVEAVGGRIILMASRALAACAAGPADYEMVYGRILRQVREPVLIHWLGEMFDPALEGYWGTADHMAAMDVCLSILSAHADKVDGIKISLLDDCKEIAMRRRLPPNMRMYTGDDFNYPALIAGDDEGFSHALLGIFDAIAPAASAALLAMARDDMDQYYETLAPTVSLSRHIFRAPTRFYKTGIVFMAYLNGHQDHFTMVAGQESARSTLHLSELFRLADKAGLLRDPETAASRMAAVLAVRGVV